MGGPSPLGSSESPRIGGSVQARTFMGWSGASERYDSSFGAGVVSGIATGERDGALGSSCAGRRPELSREETSQTPKWVRLARELGGDPRAKAPEIPPIFSRAPLGSSESPRVGGSVQARTFMG